MMRAVDLAVELSRRGAHFVVVGGAARRLAHGRSAPDPRDLDVVVASDDVDAFAAAARALGCDLTAARLRRCRDVHVDTAWGPLDVFVTDVPVVVVAAGEPALRVVA